MLEGSTLFVYIADVYCPWCYAFAPVMKRIVAENPEIPVLVLGGNLISQPTTLADDVAASDNLVGFWEDVQTKSGQSFAGAIKAAKDGRMVRMYSPGADEILTVLSEYAPGHELEQLFYLEDLFYAQGRDLFDEATLNEIAERWDVKPEPFQRALDSAKTKEVTDAKLEEAAEVMGDISAYPTLLLVRRMDVAVVSRGFVHYETVATRLKNALEEMGLEKLENEFCSRSGTCSAGPARG